MFVDELRDAEVEQLHAFGGDRVVGDEDVRRLEIAVHDPRVMHDLKAAQHRTHDLEGVPNRHRAFLDDRAEVFAFEPLERQIHRADFGAPRVDRANEVRVGEGAEDLNLALETLGEDLVDVRKREDFQRDLITGRLIDRFIDAAHSAKRCRSDDPVAAVEKITIPKDGAERPGPGAPTERKLARHTSDKVRMHCPRRPDRGGIELTTTVMTRALVASVLLASCAEGTDPLPGVAPQMRFADRDAFYASPFPSDHRRTDTGIEMAAFPNPNRIEFITQIRRLARDNQGFGLSSAVFFSLDGAAEVRASDLFDSVGSGAVAFVAEAANPTDRVPVDVFFDADGGPFGAPNLVSLLPLQGTPLKPNTAYVAVLMRQALSDAGGGPLGVSLQMRQLIKGVRPDGLSEVVFEAYREALEALEATGVDVDSIAGLAVFTTGDPTEQMVRLTQTVIARERPTPEQVRLTEVFDDYCVFTGTIDMPVFQRGDPPYSEQGGEWVIERDELVRQSYETANIVFTLPRAPMPAAGFPTVLFVRTGGGGDRPLVDRGVRPAAGADPIETGSGPAADISRAGFAAISVDGPHGGRRNVTRADEQFLVINFFNPTALRDNIRQSALELALMTSRVGDLTVTATSCPGLSMSTQVAKFDSSKVAIMGHSMGATIAPLTLAAQPALGAIILSGAGGSWIENVIFKQSPIVVRPVAELLIEYEGQGRMLTRQDPVLSVLQWAGEAADPPVYARRNAGQRHVLMFQGIVDTYILPPIANALSLSYGLDLGGDALEPSLEPLLSLVDRARVDLPVRANRGVTGVVVQHQQDRIEDGHEVMFQTEAPKRQYRCFLSSWLDGDPVVVGRGARNAPCQ